MESILDENITGRHHQWSGEMGFYKWQVNKKTGKRLKTPRPCPSECMALLTPDYFV